MNPMMKCGHAANAVSYGKPVCAICLGIRAGAEVIDAAAPSLEGRMAKCSYAKRRDGSPCVSCVASSPKLAFFEAKPGAPFDEFYCGCWGWE